jgi:hypothetical protein
MSKQHLAVSLLLRIYPASWRGEYGAELMDILVARSLTFRVVGDVVRHGLWQRVRSAEPSVLLGLASMLVVLAGFVLTPTNYDQQWTGVLRPTGITFPTVTVTFMASEVYAFLLIGCGCWTHLRYGVTPRRAGVAAMKMSLIAGIPVMFAGALMALGLLDIVIYPSYGTQRYVPFSLVIMIAPLLRLPESWIWGWVGAQIGRRIARWRQPAAA